jgi:1,4-alpha-glucan branching enzyme
MPIGYFSLILHAHLPFVRHPEYPEFLEEDWLYEAITEVYLPLIFIFQRLHEAGAKPSSGDEYLAAALRNARR